MSVLARSPIGTPFVSRYSARYMKLSALSVWSDTRQCVLVGHGVYGAHSGNRGQNLVRGPGGLKRLGPPGITGAAGARDRHPVPSELGDGRRAIAVEIQEITRERRRHRQEGPDVNSRGGEHAGDEQLEARRRRRVGGCGIEIRHDRIAARQQTRQASRRNNYSNGSRAHIPMPRYDSMRAAAATVAVSVLSPIRQRLASMEKKKLRAGGYAVMSCTRAMFWLPKLLTSGSSPEYLKLDQTFRAESDKRTLCTRPRADDAHPVAGQIIAERDLSQLDVPAILDVRRQTGIYRGDAPRRRR